MDKVALVPVFLQVLPFSPVIIPPTLHTRVHLNTILTEGQAGSRCSLSRYPHPTSSLQQFVRTSQVPLTGLCSSASCHQHRTRRMVAVLRRLMCFYTCKWLAPLIAPAARLHSWRSFTANKWKYFHMPHRFTVKRLPLNIALKVCVTQRGSTCKWAGHLWTEMLRSFKPSQITI